METIVLASSSQWRKEILIHFGFPLMVRHPEIDENSLDHLPPGPRTVALSACKARAVREDLRPDDPRWILGADTLVVASGRIFGKAENETQARDFLLHLRNTTHSVYTGLCVIDSAKDITALRLSQTQVRFNPLSDRQIETYIESGEWKGVAGGYRIQETAACFIDRIEGSFHGVVGLPIAELYGMLAALGYSF
jgi:septum formation protein